MKFLLTTVLFSLFISLNAQITGTVKDAADLPLPGASVALYNGQELITGSSTDIDGKFSLTAPAGNYRLEISYIAFQKRTMNVSIRQGETVSLGSIVLQEEAGALEEVVIEAEANFMEFQQDKRVFNVAKDLSNVGSNASDILRNLPSVDVDIDGNVSLRGSENVRILIDGKPSGLVGVNPADALRQLQGGMIERIEVITNPSARYDAEGEAGIINIVLKKENRSGLNGTFEAHTGVPHNHGGSAGINYRSGKFNFFTNVSFNYRESPGGGESYQRFFYPDTTYSFERDQERVRGGYGGALRFGADYDLTPNQTITGTFLYRPGLENNISTLTYRDYDSEGNLVRSVVREDNEKEEEKTLEGDLHYERVFEGKDHKLTADFKYQDSRDLETSDIIQTTSNEPEALFQKVRNQEDEQTILLQTDYLKPFGEKRSFETGAKATFRTIVNNYMVTEEEDGIYEELPEYTNNFRYLENIYAGYAIYNGSAGEKITYQTGLRAEYTDLSTELESEVEPVNKRYFNLFPSAFFTYDLNVRSDLQLSYSRRLSRPRFRHLLPFYSFSDNRNLYTGNPDLDPEFTDSYELAYIRYWENVTLYSGLYYRHRTGVIDRILTVNDTGLTELFPVNLAVQDAYGFEFNLSMNLFKWWISTANINLYRAITVGDYEGTRYDSDNYSAQGRIMNRLMFWDSELQASMNLRAPQTTTQGRTMGIYTLDLGWSKDILQKKATIALSVRDVFNSRRRRSFTSGENFTNRSEFQWRSRQFTVSFTYRINQNKQKQGQQGGGFSGDEMEEM